MPKFKKYFAITAGRTGTAWLADFLSLNIGIKCIHEPSGILDFGVNMPDIKTMRAFNEWGNCELVKDFWKRKIQNVMQSDEYAETNHTLAKCGLVENIAPSELADDSGGPRPSVRRSIDMSWQQPSSTCGGRGSLMS